MWVDDEARNRNRPPQRSHFHLRRLEVTGHEVLASASVRIGPEEWEGLEYLPWKSGGDTEFAPIASAVGELDCGGFWDHDKPDKGGLWTSNALRCPAVVRWVRSVGASFGRVRIIRLEPQDYEAALGRLHLDVNNRMNPPGEGWIVRAWLELTHNPKSFMIVRRRIDDPSTESRIHLPAGRQYVIDSERLFHAVTHVGDRPRYALIASFESGPALDRWMTAAARSTQS